MIYRDHFQNYKRYSIPKAQLIIADIPYNLGNNAYASNPAWYKDGDNANGESDKAGKSFFDTDEDFRPAEKPYEFYKWAASKYLKIGDKIVDPFVGSASSLVVFEEMGFEYVAYELDADYYRDSTTRLEALRAQPKLFTGGEIFRATQGEQGTLFEL